MSPELQELLDKAKARVEQMTDEERQKMFQEQRESFVRGMMAKCEHGVLDFEQCGECRAKYKGGG